MKRLSILCALLLSLYGCGGGGGSSNASGASQVDSTFPPLQETPPVGPLTNSASADSLANICTPDGEKSWVRAHLDDVYLWYKEIVNVPPSQYASVEDYFNALLVKSKDRFSFTASQAEIDQYFQSGAEFGYGFNLVLQGNRLRVSYAIPGTPADQQKVDRGAEIVGINGVPITKVSVADQIKALYPSAAGQTNTFQVLDAGASAARTVQLTSAEVIKKPVLKTNVITTDTQKKVGYLAFTDHIVTAEQPLIDAVTQFKQKGIDELVLDVRYNGGGYLYIASELASMIGGTAVQGKVFEQLQFNDKHPEKTNNPDNKVPFYDGSTKNQALPQLNLKRVFVLTGPDTCSASEAIINGLSPFVQVITLGGATCGKPYGFIQKNNCGKAYFAIEFSGVNALGKGDYVNGFAPSCSMTDDLEHPLGDSGERLLAGAISYSKSGSCPAVSFSPSNGFASGPESTRQLYRAPWREQRLLR